MSLLERTRDPLDERRLPPSTRTNQQGRRPELSHFMKNLTAAQVKAIKRACKAGVPVTRLARRFGVAT
jgi:hypothetical protein